MLEIILIVIAVLIAGVLIAAAMQPSAFRIERSTVVNAPPEKVFPLINDLRAFNTWNPFLKMEPESKLTYTGPAQGKGAAYSWEGRKTGAGNMEITDTTPSRITMGLEFTKPFAAKNVAEFSMEGRDGSTNVTWAMSGQNSFVPKLMGLFFSMDKMVGTTFAEGLADLKTKAEA
jgi:uncharacterized protein YndB with AHSA1/START domain